VQLFAQWRCVRTRTCIAEQAGSSIWNSLQTFYCRLEAPSKEAVKPRLHDTTGCQTGCQTALTTGCIVYANIQQPAVSCIQPVVKPVVQRGLTNRLNDTVRLNEEWLFVQHGCQTGCQAFLTTGWMFVYTIQPVDNRLYRVNGVLQ